MHNVKHRCDVMTLNEAKKKLILHDLSMHKAKQSINRTINFNAYNKA